MVPAGGCWREGDAHSLPRPTGGRGELFPGFWQRFAPSWG